MHLRALLVACLACLAAGRTFRPVRQEPGRRPAGGRRPPRPQEEFARRQGGSIRPEAGDRVYQAFHNPSQVQLNRRKQPEAQQQRQQQQRQQQPQRRLRPVQPRQQEQQQRPFRPLAPEPRPFLPLAPEPRPFRPVAPEQEIRRPVEVRRKEQEARRQEEQEAVRQEQQVLRQQEEVVRQQQEVRRQVVQEAVRPFRPEEQEVRRVERRPVQEQTRRVQESSGEQDSQAAPQGVDPVFERASHAGHRDFGGPAEQRDIESAVHAGAAAYNGGGHAPPQRLSFQIHGQDGPHSYRYGYDTGEGYNRQFKYEERNSYGVLHGRYGYYDQAGKLQIVNYTADPEKGFHAEGDHVPKPGY